MTPSIKERVAFFLGETQILVPEGGATHAPEHFFEGQVAALKAVMQMLESPGELLPWERGMREQRKART